MSEPLLAVEDLNGYYGTAHVLQGVSFTVGAEPVALIGRNGMGKSTLCKAIAGLRERARGWAEAVGLADRLDAPVMDLSHGEHRQLEVGMARASEPKLMMLDEPAAGLSRAERVKLTELLLTLDPGITLILIEHDMDVALRVAQWVTMMHDGRVIVEGTPDEIRANQTVHDLYLGSGLIHHE